MDIQCAKVEIEVLKKSISKLEKQIDDECDKNWLVDGVDYWYVSDEKVTSGKWNRDAPNVISNVHGQFETKEDAELALKWMKMQKLTWLPEGVETFYCASFNGYSKRYRGTVPDVQDFANGNIHKTGEEAVSYGETMRAVAEMRKRYL